MKESDPRKKGTGKAARRGVSPRRELAVVTLAAVASISGVGGLLAAGQHAGAPFESTSTPTSRAVTVPAQPKTHQRTLAVAQASYRGDDGEEAGDDGHAAFQPAKKVRLVHRKANVAWSPTSHASPATVSQGSVPVN